MGLGIGILANSRPYEGLILCIPVAIAILWWLFSRRSPGWRITVTRVVLPVTAMVVLTVGFAGYYNWRVTGSPTLFPHSLHEQQYESVSSFIWNGQRPPMHYMNHEFDVVYNHMTRNSYRYTWDDFERITGRKLHDFIWFFLGPILLVPFVTVPLLLANRRLRFLLFQFAFFCLGTVVVIWFHPHYAAPIVATLFVLVTQMFRYMRRWTHLGRPVGIGLARAVIIFSAAAIPYFGIQTAMYPEDVPGSGWGNSNWERARIVDELDAIPGRHLVVVRYSQTHHDVRSEWVYNAADIDHSRTVWVREIPGIDIHPLLDYFKDRKVWLVVVDTLHPQIESYAPLPAVSSNAGT
jgi:hypothetical protein